MFQFAAICTKHPGFSEEQEWRAIYLPKLGEPSHLKMEIRSISGVPQLIYKIPLRNIPGLFNRLIIGPTQYPGALRDAFVELLTKAGVEKAAEKVFVSHIPLRR